MLHDSCENFFRNSSANVNIMISINKNFRFNDRNKSVLLTDRSITSERKSSFLDGYIRWAAFINFNDCSPFSKTASHSIIFCASFAKSIKTSGGSLFVSSSNFNKPAINLDTSMDATGAKVINKLGSV